MISEPDYNIPSFEEDGYRFFKPASYVKVEMNKRLREELESKYDMKKIIHRIAIHIDEISIKKQRVAHVILSSPNKRVLTFNSTNHVIENIQWDDQLNMVKIINGELLANGYTVKCPKKLSDYFPEERGEYSQICIEW